MCEQSLNDYITEQCALIDAALDRLLPAENESPETIHKAMRYSIFCFAFLWFELEQSEPRVEE